MQKKFNLFILLIALMLVGCDETKKVIDVAGSVQLSGTYTVTELSSNMMNSKENQTLTMSAIDKSIRGNTGCNSFFGSYENDLNVLTFTDLAQTEMACEPTIMTAEQVFMRALENTGSYTLENKQLTLLSKSDRSVLLKATKNIN